MINTVSSGGENTLYQQILEKYNQLCELKGLRPIRSIEGKRQSKTVSRFSEYGFDGFTDLFEKFRQVFFYAAAVIQPRRNQVTERCHLFRLYA